MIDEYSTNMNDSIRSQASTLANVTGDIESDSELLPVPQFDDGLMTFDDPSEMTAQADRRNTRRKLAAGWRGLKSAMRGDSSFFAHGYRGTLVAITAALLGVNQWSWCLLVIAFSLVLVAELAHSAVDTLARAIGDPEEPRLKTAGEIAAAGVMVAVIGAGIVTTIVLFVKFSELLRSHA